MKILYHTPTQTLRSYPRADDEPVVGLSADYQVFDVIQAPPPNYDGTTHYLSPTETVNVEAKTITRGWEVAVIQTPPLTVTKRSLLLKMTPTQTSALAAWMASMPEGIKKRDAQIYYRDSTTVSRSHPMVGFFGAALNLDAVGLDTLFAAAREQDQLEAAYLS